MPNQSHSRYPYACLNMAVLQADFGCHEEALPAIAEAINAARESSDHSCLAFSLSWLYHFRLVDRSEETQVWANKMLGADDAGLTYLRQQARRYELRSLESSILVSQTRVVIARVRARMVRADHKLTYT
jgi:anaphase-promoting complex subunit 5